MKATIKTDPQGSVTLSYDSDGERRTRVFIVRVDGGYIWEQHGHELKQVCGKLASRGDTLVVSSRRGLAEKIRYEYRAMRRAEAKE